LSIFLLRLTFSLTTQLRLIVMNQS
jgi:hypothetical protein